MMWTLVAATGLMVVVGAIALLLAIARLGRELPRALEALDAFGREMRPALIRVRTATDDVRTRTPQP